MAVQARTLEFYRQLGIAGGIVGNGIRLKAIHLRAGSREIAGFQFDDIASSISPFPFVLSLPQDDHERLLVKFLEAAGVGIEWNTSLVGFTQQPDNVVATIRKGENEERCAFSHLVGCDGARSTVRQTLGLNFPGGTYQRMFYVADVEARGLPFDDDVNACITRGSFVLAFPVRSSGMFRLIGVVPMELDHREDITFEDIRPHVKAQIDVDVRKVNWFSTYRVHHRVADHFRRDRVFIAGDAGHIHSPAGGQGMNTGIGDAVNLAWKLAAVIQGRANPEILDTYESERIEFARALVKTTDRIFQAVVRGGLPGWMMRQVFLRRVIPLLLRSRAARTAQFRLVSQTRIAYPHSALSVGKGGRIGGGDRLPFLERPDNFKPLDSLDWQIHIFGSATDELKAISNQRRVPIHSFEYDSEAQSAGFARTPSI